MSEAAQYEGGCHCGAVRFRVRVMRHRAIECNCSICSRKGFLHLIVPPEDFDLLQGEGELATYTFHTGVAKHRFCKTCGIHPFYRPRSHPDQVSVNLRCLEDASLDGFEIEGFDGSRWEENIEQIRPMGE